MEEWVNMKVGGGAPQSRIEGMQVIKRRTQVFRGAPPAPVGLA